MKKNRLLLAGLALLTSSVVSAQSVFSENFDGTTPLSNWTLINVDGLTPHPNVAVINDAWVVLSGAGGDNFAGSTSWYSPAGTANDYMITPPIALTSSNYLFFEAQAPDANFRDGYEVRISTTTPTVAGLNANPALYSTSGENPTWTERQINLSAYSGQTVYLAWRNNSSDKYLLFVNNVEVKEVYANDAEVISLDIDNQQTDGDTLIIRGALRNTGTNTLTSVEVNWSADSGTTVNTDVISLNLNSFAEANFTHSVKLPITNPGTFKDISVWTSQPNMVPDSNTVNDTVSTRFFVNNGITVSRNVLLEEFTTAPCQFCPDGAVVVEQILNSNPAVIAVGEHACFSTDAMTIPEASTYCNDFSSGAPTACIDRILFDGESEVGHSRSRWAANASARANIGSPVSVNISGSYNPSTRMVTANITADFVDYATPGDIRMTLFIVEDSVTGSGPGYNQVNAYNNQAGHPYAGAGNPIVGFEHKHVLRDVYPSNDAYGEAGIIPNNPAPNSSYSKTYTFALNNAWKADDISMVAFVNYDNVDVTQRPVLNAAEVQLTNLITGVKEVQTGAKSFKLYPNPTNGISNMEFNLNANTQASIVIRDITGKEVMRENFGVLSAGFQKIQLNMDAMINGIYFATLQLNDETVTRKISVNK